MTEPPIRRWARAGALLLALGLAASALAQGRQRSREFKPPPTAESVLRSIEAPYLTDEERAAKRVFHGLWTDSDLAVPALRARAALIVRAYDDPVFDRADINPEDRAEALVARGDLDRGLGALAGRESARAARLRAEALEGLGRFEEASAAVAPIIERFTSESVTSAADLVEGVRALAVRARIEGRPPRDYQTMLDLLVRAQDQLDRLYWPAVVMQAQTLYERSNLPEAGGAAGETLALNPSSGDAWRLLGRLAVDGFDFDRAEAVVKRLNALSARLSTSGDATSADADLILARAAMRQLDAVLAQQYILRVLARFPLHREALALQAAVEALLFEYENADALLAELDQLSPGTPLGHFEVGRALSESRQYEKAAQYLNEAARRQPRWAEPIAELGLLEMQSGRDTLALTALEKAVELDPYNTRAANSLTLVRDLAEYGTVESEHFIIRHPRGVEGVMAREMVGPLEEIHRHVSSIIEHSPPRKTVIELLPDHQTFAVRITGMTGIHTIAAATGPLIAMEAPRAGKLHNGEYDWVRVVRHEYTHTVTLSRTSNRIPHWFTEAAAVYCEGAPRDLDTCRLLVAALTGQNGFSLFDMEQINIAFVRPRRPTDRSQAYAQGHWMYEYITQRWGTRAPLELMDLYALGIKEEQAMERVLKVTQAEFLEGFRAWARQDCAPWGLTPERSLRSLLVEQTLADPDRGAAAARDLARAAAGSAFTLSGVGGGVLFELELVEPAGDVLAALAQQHPDHPDVLELLVLDALQRAGGTPTEAMIPLLERYAAARPVDPMPHRHLARLYLAGPEPEKAIEHLEYLDAREQKSAAYAVELSRRYAALEEWDRAGAKAERATQIAPFDPAHREFAATVAIRRGDLATAERHVLALTELEPQQPIHKQRLERVRAMRDAG
ncbi:MAG: hypothetical protein SFZ24_07550 [Planctomycetota bacterium]|nr:hypothetical protein [Planctomycetota bacterium]